LVVSHATRTLCLLAEHYSILADYLMYQVPLGVIRKLPKSAVVSHLILDRAQHPRQSGWTNDPSSVTALLWLSAEVDYLAFHKQPKFYSGGCGDGNALAE
jgi:hypothetical protein